MALTKTKQKHKLDRHMDEATREAIFQKIAASMAKKAAKPRHNCPACGVLITRLGGILRHMDSCCPDLLTPEERAKVGWASIDVLQAVCRQSLLCKQPLYTLPRIPQLLLQQLPQLHMHRMPHLLPAARLLSSTLSLGALT
jgi:hypothetical protein